MHENVPMRVLHVITALGVGGAEHMLLKLVGAPAMAGFEHRVVALLPGGALAAPLAAAGAGVEELDLMGGVPLIGGAVQLALHARRYAPDLVQGWLYHGNLGAMLARRVQRRRVPLVWGIRQSLPSLRGENVHARAAIRLSRILSSQPDCLLFNSQVSIEQHRDFGFDVRRAQHLPNGFDTRRFAPDEVARARLRQAWGVSPDEVVFGLVARYHPVKDHAGFLRAAGLALRARPSVRLVLAGPGIDAAHPALLQQVAEAGLAGRVSLLGVQHDVPALLSALDVYVSASLAEAFSNAVGEAMSCALPCIVTSVGDSASVLGNAGRVVPPRAPEALSRAMVELVDLGSTGRAVLGRQARARVESAFGLDAVAQRQATLYRQLVG